MTSPSSNTQGERFEHLRPEATALVIGASGGIGAAIAAALDREPRFRQVLRTGRSSGLSTGLSTGLDIENGATDSADTHLTLDLASDASIETAAEAIRARTEQLDLVLICSGLLHDDELGIRPEKRIDDLRRSSLQRHFEINAIGPALLAAALAPLLPRQDRCIWGTLSARVGSIEDNHLGGWYGYRASKAAQNMFTRSLAIELGRRHKGLACVALHPGTVATDLSAPFRSADARGVMEPEVAAGHLLDVVNGLGPEHTGGFFAWDARRIPW